MAALPLRKSETPARGARFEVLTRRRRWPAVVLVAAASIVFGALLGIAVFHTQLAERQLEIDRLEKAVRIESERFDDLRHERAVLRSPARLDQAADELLMVRGASSKFVRVAPEELAKQLAAAGVVGDDPIDIIVELNPLDQFRDVKSVSAGQP